MGFPREDRTECELEEWNDCKDLRVRVGGTNWGAKCDNNNDLFMDDDCLGHASQEECDKAWNLDNEKKPMACPAHAGGCKEEPENNSLFEQISGMSSLIPTPQLGTTSQNSTIIDLLELLLFSQLSSVIG